MTARPLPTQVPTEYAVPKIDVMPPLRPPVMAPVGGLPVIERSTSTPVDAPMCCMMMSKECLACQKGVSVAEFCKDLANMEYCGGLPVIERCPVCSPPRPKPGCKLINDPEKDKHGCLKHPCGLMVCEQIQPPRPQIQCPLCDAPPGPKPGCKLINDPQKDKHGCMKYPCGLMVCEQIQPPRPQ